MGAEGGVRMDKDCRNCEHGKDKFKDSCYCTYYGYIQSKPKKDCRGWEEQSKDNKEEKE
jgi:hypothetical protein